MTETPSERNVRLALLAGQLHVEVERLRALLEQHGIDPDQPAGGV